MPDGEIGAIQLVHEAYPGQRHYLELRGFTTNDANLFIERRHIDSKNKARCKICGEKKEIDIKCPLCRALLCSNECLEEHCADRHKKYYLDLTCVEGRDERTQDD